MQHQYIPTYCGLLASAHSSVLPAHCPALVSRQGVKRAVGAEVLAAPLEARREFTPAVVKVAEEVITEEAMVV